MNRDECLLMNNNLLIPQLSLGTYKTSDEEISEVTEKSISIGYRHLDCAWIYGNEKGIGNGLANQLKKGQIKRSELFITSKLWCTFHKFERVRQQCLITINDLQCQYLDLFLIHWPMAFVDQDPNVTNTQPIKIDDSIDFIESWKAMELLVDEGLIKSIGLSNFNEKQIERILQICKHKPVINQVEIHPYCPQLELEEFCNKHQILLAAYAPLGARNRDGKTDNDPELLDDKIIKSMAEKHHVQPATLLLRYILDRNIVCIAKSANEQRMKDNFQIFKEKKFRLTKEDYQEIHRQIPTRFRYHKMTDGMDSKEHPFKDWKDFIPKN